MKRIQFDIITGPLNTRYPDLDSYIESTFPNGDAITAGLIDDDFCGHGLQWAFYCRDTADIRAFMATVAAESQTTFRITEREASEQECERIAEMDDA